MTAVNPPAFLQNGSHTAATFRRLTAGMLSRPGRAKSGHLTVAKSGSGLNYTVSPGSMFIAAPTGGGETDNGWYFVTLSSTANYIAGTDPVLATREDLYARVRDTAVNGGDAYDAWEITVNVTKHATSTDAQNFVPPTYPGATRIGHVIVAPGQTELPAGSVYNTTGMAQGIGGVNSGLPAGQELSVNPANATVPGLTYGTVGGVQTPVQNLYVAPRASGIRTTAQAIATTATAISLTGTSWDTDTMFSAGAPTRLTCKTAGLYLVDAQIGFSTSDARRIVYIRRNNISTEFYGFIGYSLGASTTGFMSTSAQIFLAVGDYIELVAYAAVATTTSTSASNPIRLQAVRVSA